MLLTQLAPGGVDLRGKRLLIFIVAYNAESTIEKVLTRIPKSLHSDQVEVLIMDDSSQDETFRNGLRYQQRQSDFRTTVLRTPVNQGYGGNQKLGYRYAIDHGFVCAMPGMSFDQPSKRASAGFSFFTTAGSMSMRTRARTATSWPSHRRKPLPLNHASPGGMFSSSGSVTRT